MTILKTKVNRAGWLWTWVALLTAAASGAVAAVPYDIVYVRQPRYGDDTNTIWPEVFHPARLDPGADLMLLHQAFTLIDVLTIPAGRRIVGYELLNPCGFRIQAVRQHATAKIAIGDHANQRARLMIDYNRN